MPTVDYDLRYLRAGVEQLEDYLLVEDVYRSIGVSPPRGEPPYPQMTLGWLLLYRRRIETLSLTPAQGAEAARLTSQMDIVYTRWRVAWGKKATREFGVRLGQWGNFIQDYRDAPGANYDRYPYEVNRRVILQLLETEAGGSAPGLSEQDLKMLDGLDAILKAYLSPCSFIWGPDLAAGFPQAIFWYLYGKLPSRQNE